MINQYKLIKILKIQIKVLINPLLQAQVQKIKLNKINKYKTHFKDGKDKIKRKNLHSGKDHKASNIFHQNSNKLLKIFNRKKENTHHLLTSRIFLIKLIKILLCKEVLNLRKLTKIQFHYRIL